MFSGFCQYLYLEKCIHLRKMLLIPLDLYVNFESTVFNSLLNTDRCFEIGKCVEIRLSLRLGIVIVTIIYKNNGIYHLRLIQTKPKRYVQYLPDVRKIAHLNTSRRPAASFICQDAFPLISY